MESYEDLNCYSIEARKADIEKVQRVAVKYAVFVKYALVGCLLI
jgi:hypothetical protein